MLNEKSRIGVTAPSSGLRNSIDVCRFQNAKMELEKRGYRVIETKNVWTEEKGVSSRKEERAHQVEELLKNPEVSLILTLRGGDFLVEMLSCLDFEILRQNPKWIQGYSDSTGLLFIATTMLDIATIYGPNFLGFGMHPWYQDLENNVEIWKGNLLPQHSYKMYEKESLERVTGLEGYHLDTKVEWKSLFQNSCEIEGRLIGGCFDILVELVGTRFDSVKEFIERYKEDGIIWYLDNCDLTSEGVIRGLWHLKEAGWFQHTKGILFGRSKTNDSVYEISFEEALRRSLEELEVPVLWDLDFGHLPPSMTLINGAMAKVTYQNKKGTIEMKLVERP